MKSYKIKKETLKKDIKNKKRKRSTTQRKEDLGVSLVALGLGGLGPLQVTLHGATDELVLSVDDTLGEGSELLERRGGQVDLVGGTAGAVINDADDDGAAARGDLGALEAGSLLTTLVEPHGNGTNVPTVTGVDVGVVLQIAVASNLLMTNTNTTAMVHKQGEEEMTWDRK